MFDAAIRYRIASTLLTVGFILSAVSPGYAASAPAAVPAEAAGAVSPLRSATPTATATPISNWKEAIHLGSRDCDSLCSFFASVKYAFGPAHPSAEYGCLLIARRRLPCKNRSLSSLMNLTPGRNAIKETLRDLTLHLPIQL
jgi:hypothetical protein